MPPDDGTGDTGPTPPDAADGRAGEVADGDPPATRLSFLRDAISAADAAAFVHVGDRTDLDLRYLTRLRGPDRPYAFVAVPDRAAVCVPSGFRARARRAFLRDAVSGEGDGDDRGVARAVRAGDAEGDASAGRRAARAVSDLLSADGDADTDAGDATVAVPRHLPHDAAVALERAGYDLTATPAVRDARATKTDVERSRLRAVQAAATRGMARAAAILLAAAEPAGDPDRDRLRWAGDPLSTRRLRREVNATLARAGVSDAGDTAVGAGETCAAPSAADDRPVRPGETVVVDLSPRGPHGYRGALTRTFVIAGGGGWERRAHVAVTAARRTALATVAPGVDPGSVREEAAAELLAHGFAADGTERGFVRGVGLSPHEAPSSDRDEEFALGHVVAVEAGVRDPDRGCVGVADLAVVTADGADPLVSFPVSLAPDGDG